MKLISFGESGKEKPRIIKEEKWYDVSSFVKDYEEDFFANCGVNQLKKIAAEYKLPEVDSNQRLGCPVFRPSKVICIGLNYAKHAKHAKETMKYIRIIFCGIFIFFCTAIYAQKKQIRVTCVGNSITYGDGVQDREKNSYPAQLQAMLGKEYEVTNFGVSGRTLLRKGNLPYWKENAFTEALKSNPNVVFIMLGTNDSKAINRPFYNDFVQDYCDLIDSFRNLLSHPRVIMLLPTKVFTKDVNQIYDSVIVNSIIPMCREVAYKKKSELIDLHPMFVNKKNLLSDGVHPTSLGDKLIAQRLYEQLQLVVEKRNIFSKIKEPITISDFMGYECADFKLGGRDCKIVKPRTAALKGNPWIWRARFWGHEPQTDIALLERGFYVAYCDVSELYGNKQAINVWNDFYKKMLRVKLNRKAVMEGMSRGGAYVYDWAAKNPHKISCVYADAPVLDFKSWPGGKGASAGSKEDWEIFKKDYNLTEQQALDFKGNPLDKVKEIVAGHYPMLHVVGDADTIVPVAENTAKFEKAVKALGGDIEVIHKPGVNHHPHSLPDPEPIVNFILHATHEIK